VAVRGVVYSGGEVVAGVAGPARTCPRTLQRKSTVAVVEGVVDP